eukprot:CAMPEP_0177224428 /NCGR_PEP_ID=MMETSP0367-20130122/39013_1 /TAXON_ID=447022 ORGANISM="Scrippsiella hangoei-like, Strain SHHI-4" /NCGR_SAMPLE_ID=MMETSP0367 /ASSEMBLY_ACC=CAM_ASM_000362 /LENGTH=216 /DNA_ID=CAMNT_0018674465 /DNA_START=64 /DNA_END=714 /DNA_ORIENTATION=-
MSCRVIQELLDGDDRYEVASVEVLEEHLKGQLERGTYDLDANLAILKLYLLFPGETKGDVLEAILLKALMAFPAADFSLCMYQIPEKHHASVAKVVELAQQLEMAKFKNFWKLAAETKRLSEVTGWQSAVIDFAVGVVAATYRSIKVDELAEILNIFAGDVEKLIKEKGWSRSKEDKDVVVVSTETFISKKPVLVKEPTHMTLDQYRSMVTASSAA